MQITYHDNPLKTIVTINEQEKILLWHKIKILQMEELLTNVYFSLESTTPNIEEAKAIVDLDYYYDSSSNERSKIDLHCDKILNTYIEELSLSHIGDCTCVPCSCMKCLAEQALNIDTIQGLNKYCANLIDNYFNAQNSPDRTIDEVIALLQLHPSILQKDYINWINISGYEQNIDLWTQHATEAKEWLIQYKHKFLT